MTLPSSGTLKMSDIQGEFGGSNPIKLSEYYSAAAGVPTSGTISISDFYGTRAYTPAGSSTRTATSEGNFSVPAGVSEIHILCVGGGGAGGNAFYAGGGGAGGNLTWINKVPVTPGETLKWRAGAGGAPAFGRGDGGDGGASYVKRGSTYLCLANGGGGAKNQTAGFDQNPGGATGALWTIPAGYEGSSQKGGFGGRQEGGQDRSGGGGGAAGYTGSGGFGYDWQFGQANSGSGGGGGGSYFASVNFTQRYAAYRGGGVGLNGKGANGARGVNLSAGGGGGSGGQDGEMYNAGGLYGAGSSGIGDDDTDDKWAPYGANGAVKIMWGTDASWPDNPTNS